MKSEKKSEKISDAIGGRSEETVMSAADTRLRHLQKEEKKTTARKIWFRIASAAACLGIVGGIFFMNGRNNFLISASAETLVKAEYPEVAPYPDEELYHDASGLFDSDAFDRVYESWRGQRTARQEAKAALGDLSDFYLSTARTFLSDSGTENRVYSPVSLYTALSMLAETTGGESRAQLLSLLGAENIEALRSKAKNLWTANYQNDGATTSILADSLWLNQSVGFVEETVERLAKDYYASSYRGDPASTEFNQALRDWLNEQTGGLLKEAVEHTSLSPETILAIYSTVYFRAKWAYQFRSANNDKKIFHAVSGDQTAEFMNAADDFGRYYWADDFGAICLHFVNGGGMWLILPDEGKTVDDVLSSGDYLEMIQKSNRGEWKNTKSLIVRYSVPKFDVSSDLQLIDGLTSLGIEDIFEAERADFVPLLGNSDSEKEAFVGNVRQAVRVVIDEEGCTAAAFTEIALSGAGMPSGEKMDFILDRPFVFAITGDTGEILFIGTVMSVDNE